MPKIPDIGPSVGVRTDPSGPQNINIGADAFGGRTAQALTNLGNVGQHITLNLQKQRNVVEAQKAFLEASRELDQFLHNPEDGVYSNLGSKAPGSFQNTADKLPEIAGKHTVGLNDAQRKLFDRFWAQTSEPALTGALRHEENQLKNEKVNTADALAKQNINSMSLNYGDPKAVKMFAGNVESAVDLAAEVRGLPLAQRQVLKQEALTKGYSQVFEQYYKNEDYEGAEKVLNDYGDQMQARVVSKLRADVRVKKEDVRIQENRDIIVAEFGTDYEGALAAATDRYKGSEETKVINALKTHYSDQQSIQAKKDADVFYTNLNKIQEAGGRSQAMVIADRETDPQKRFQLRNAVDQKFPVASQASLVARSKSQLKEQEATRVAQAKIDIQDFNDKDKAMALANAEKDPATKLALRSFVAHTYPSVKAVVSPEQKEKMELWKTAGNNGISKLIKIRYAKNPHMDKSDASIAMEMQKSGIYDPKILKDISDYVNNDGPYKNIVSRTTSRLRELGLAKNYQKGSKGPVEIPQQLVDFMANASANKGGELNEREFNTTLQDALSGVIVQKPGVFWGENEVEEPWYKHYRTSGQEGYDAIKTMKPVDRDNMKALMSWGLKKDNPSHEEINEYAVSWLPGAYDMTNRGDSEKVKRFYEYGKAFVGRVMDYRTESGGRVQRRITDSDLSRKEFWSEIFKTYPARSKK